MVRPSALMPRAELRVHPVRFDPSPVRYVWRPTVPRLGVHRKGSMSLSPTMTAPAPLTARASVHSPPKGRYKAAMPPALVQRNATPPSAPSPSLSPTTTEPSAFTALAAD